MKKELKKLFKKKNELDKLKILTPHLAPQLHKHFFENSLNH
jgi:hypothetical protein